LRYGSHVEQLLQAQEAGNEVQALKDRPYLYDDLLWVYTSFFMLNRPQGMSAPSGIPTSEILAYLDLHGVDDIAERTEFFRFIKVLDRTWLKYQASQTKSKTK